MAERVVRAPAIEPPAQAARFPSRLAADHPHPAVAERSPVAVSPFQSTPRAPLGIEVSSRSVPAPLDHPSVETRAARAPTEIPPSPHREPRVPTQTGVDDFGRPATQPISLVQPPSRTSPDESRVAAPAPRPAPNPVAVSPFVNGGVNAGQPPFGFGPQSPRTPLPPPPDYGHGLLHLGDV